jgi:hypothetical protein
MYIKRRQRLRRQAMQTWISIDLDAGTSGPVSETREMSQAHGTLTPFTLPAPLNIPSRLRAPFTKSSFTNVPPVQLHTRDQPNPNQPHGNADLRADSVGDTMVEMMQNMQSMQRQLLHLLGERNRDQNRLRRTSTHQSGEDPIENVRSDGTSDVPPTYQE